MKTKMAARFLIQGVASLIWLILMYNMFHLVIEKNMLASLVICASLLAINYIVYKITK